MVRDDRPQGAKVLSLIMEVLDELAGVHPYFKLLRLDWKYRFERVKQNEYRGMVDLLPLKMISHIPSTIDTMQKQIEALFAAALDIDGEKKPVLKKLAEYYRRAGDNALSVFQFQPCSMNFEVIDSKTYAEVLYPKTVYDLIDFAVRECVLTTIFPCVPSTGALPLRPFPLSRLCNTSLTNLQQSAFIVAIWTFHMQVQR